MKRLLILAILILCPQLAFAQAPTFLCAQSSDARNCDPTLVPVPTAALAANSVIKATPGSLWSFQVSADSTLSAAAWWIMIFDASAAPADGVVTPTKCYAIASGSPHFEQTFFIPPNFLSGIVISVGTTGCFTKTASVHAFISGDAR